MDTDFNKFDPWNVGPFTPDHDIGSRRSGVSTSVLIYISLMIYPFRRPVRTTGESANRDFLRTRDSLYTVKLNKRVPLDPKTFKVLAFPTSLDITTAKAKMRFFTAPTPLPTDQDSGPAIFIKPSRWRRIFRKRRRSASLSSASSSDSYRELSTVSSLEEIRVIGRVEE